MAFTNKDTVLAEMVRYIGGKQLARVAEAWESCETLSKKLAAYADIVVLEPFDALQVAEDPQELVNIRGAPARAALLEVRDKHAEIWAEQLSRYKGPLEKAGSSAQRLARFIVATNLNLKKSETDRGRLLEQLEDLRTAVLAVTKEA